MLRGLFDRARGFIREVALNKIMDHAFAGNGEGVSRWRALREAFTTQGDVEAWNRQGDIEAALHIVRQTGSSNPEWRTREDKLAAIQAVLDKNPHLAYGWSNGKWDWDTKTGSGQTLTAEDVLTLFKKASIKDQAWVMPREFNPDGPTYSSGDHMKQMAAYLPQEP